MIYDHKKELVWSKAYKQKYVNNNTLDYDEMDYVIDAILVEKKYLLTEKQCDFLCAFCNNLHYLRNNVFKKLTDKNNLAEKDVELVEKFKELHCYTWNQMRLQYKTACTGLLNIFHNNDSMYLKWKKLIIDFSKEEKERCNLYFWEQDRDRSLEISTRSNYSATALVQFIIERYIDAREIYMEQHKTLWVKHSFVTLDLLLPEDYLYITGTLEPKFYFEKLDSSLVARLSESQNEKKLNLFVDGPCAYFGPKR